jgi:hypothetical protein
MESNGDVAGWVVRLAAGIHDNWADPMRRGELVDEAPPRFDGRRARRGEACSGSWPAIQRRPRWCSDRRLDHRSHVVVAGPHRRAPEARCELLGTFRCQSTGRVFRDRRRHAVAGASDATPIRLPATAPLVSHHIGWRVTSPALRVYGAELPGFKGSAGWASPWFVASLGGAGLQWPAGWRAT